MTLLITGASGFVGLNIVEAALARGEDVVALSIDALPSPALGAFAGLPGRLHLAQGDVLDEALIAGLFQRHRPDRVVPAAALTPGAGYERRDAGRTLMVNVVGVVRLLEMAARHGVQRVVYPSSGSVYGTNAFGPAPLDEVSTAPMPESIYAISKLAAERAALRFRAIAGLEVVAARLGTVFGPWERNTGVRETLSPQWQIMGLLDAGREVVLPTPGRRDWIYARDVAAAILALLDRPAVASPVINIAPGSEWTIADWCAALARRTKSFRWRFAAEGEAANVDYWTARDRSPMSNARLVSEMGFTPAFGMDSALDDFLAWRARVGAV